MMAGAAQHARKQRPNLRIVLDQKDASRVGVCASRAHQAAS